MAAGVASCALAVRIRCAAPTARMATPARRERRVIECERSGHCGAPDSRNVQSFSVASQAILVLLPAYTHARRQRYHCVFRESSIDEPGELATSDLVERQSRLPQAWRRR